MTNPLTHPITSSYGIPRTHIINGVTYRDVHDGIDFAYPQGTPVTLPPSGAWDGVVTYAGLDQFGGAYVDVKSDKDGGVARFLHLSRIDVKKGDRVTSNQRIGLSGGARGTWGAGHSTGAHLHLGLLVNNRAVDPKPWLEKAYTQTTIIDPNTTMNDELIKFIQGSGGSALSKDLLVKAIQSGDKEYFAKYYPAWLLEVEAERQSANNNTTSKPETKTEPLIAEQSANTADQFHKSVQERKEEVDARTKEIVNATDLIGLITEAQELNKKKLSGSEWFLGWLTFGIDKWAIITTTLSTALFYISQNVPSEYHQLLFIFGGVASLGVLFFFGANKLIDKWNKR